MNPHLTHCVWMIWISWHIPSGLHAVHLHTVYIGAKFFQCKTAVCYWTECSVLVLGPGVVVVVEWEGHNEFVLTGFVLLVFQQVECVFHEDLISINTFHLWQSIILSHLTNISLCSKWNVYLVALTWTTNIREVDFRPFTSFRLI